MVLKPLGIEAGISIYIKVIKRHFNSKKLTCFISSLFHADFVPTFNQQYLHAALDPTNVSALAWSHRMLQVVGSPAQGSQRTKGCSLPPWQRHTRAVSVLLQMAGKGHNVSRKSKQGTCNSERREAPKVLTSAFCMFEFPMFRELLQLVMI